jgi:hypothetical protein
MKIWLLTVSITICSFFASTLYAQTPQAIPYQAVARNSGGALMLNKAISLRFTIHDGSSSGAIVYQETQSAVTDNQGLFTLNIGSGTVVSGTFSSINWGTGSKFLQVEMDAAGGTTYTDMGTQQMLSVPYALYAEKSNNPGPAGPQGPAGTLGAYGTGEALALNITSNTNWTTTPPANLNTQYTTINVAAGVTFVVPSGITLRATGNVTIAGTITVSPGTADNASQKGHPGVGISAAGSAFGGTGLTSFAAAQLIHLPSYGGGSGAKIAASSGGDGGGSIRIIAQGTLQVSAGGSIIANGVSAINPNSAGQGIVGTGGGAGGIIVLLSKGILTMAGTVSAVGGNGSNGFDGNGGNSEGGGGGGGGGIIIYAAPSISTTGTSLVAGGAAGTNAGISATITNGTGGGACGGNGGNGGSSSFSTTPSAGTSGHVLKITTTTPESLLF